MKKILSVLICLLLFVPCVYAKNVSDSSKLTASAEMNVSLKDPKLVNIPNIKPINKKSYQQKTANDKRDYLTYKKLMNDDYYNLYQIFERLLRANNLSYQNWRLIIKAKAEKVNAYAGSGNMVVIYSSLYDSLYNNEDALAFVLAHELGHFVLGHHQVSMENSVKIANLEQNAVRVRKEANRDRRQARYGRKSDALGNSAAAAVGSIQEAYINASINKLYKQERLMEFEADSEAVSLMVRAGFDVNNASEALEFLAKLPDVYTNRSTHPPVAERLKNLNDEIELIDIDNLKAQGEYNLYNSKVLSAKKSSDKKTIVISKLDGKKSLEYVPEKKEDKLIKKAYVNYLNGDMKISENYFIQAHELDEKNFIPVLYLSYINEYEYDRTHDKKALKKSAYWAKKANKLKPNDKNAVKQKQDLYEKFQKLKQDTKKVEEI